MPKVMAVQEWKAALESGTSAPDVILHKTGVVEIKAGAADKREVDFTISTAAVDREHDVINQEGWDLKHYKKSPVVLFAHDYKQPPIGRTTRLRVVDGALKATVEFAPKEANPMAETVYQLVKGGFLSSASVGFKPQKHAFNAERGGVDFEKQELLEWSIVPVPANPEALMDAEGKGIDVGPLRVWAKGILAETAEPDAVVTKPRTMKPEDGKCQPGYVLGSDGLCHEKAAEPDVVKADAMDCPKSDCPMKGKAVWTTTRDQTICVAMAHDKVEPLLGERLDRIEMALVQLATPPVMTAAAEDTTLLLRVLAEEPRVATITVDEDQLRAAIDAAVAAHVAHTVRTAVNALTGRID